MKTFHELEKVGIKRFWAHKAEMSLTAISLLESTNVFLRKSEMSLTAISLLCLESRNQTFLGS